ncbi:MAG: hypothetical protein WC729_29230 [Sphingomonas sp.]|jgi:hypothetical protein|uniref:hypothetical protein n=1 Tax=Sphingomonas sp. TaxID=28214 RepID=UPI0035688459
MLGLTTNWLNGTITVNEGPVVLGSVQAIPLGTMLEVRAGRLDGGKATASLYSQACELQALLRALGHAVGDIYELT